jgi:phospholipid/cholesterol/gamma-HCH transport system permease protein
MVMFLSSALLWMFRPPLKWRRMIGRIHFIGAKQVFHTLRKFGSEGFLGSVVALSLIRELGPVLCALMVTGRAGSALTAEIGIMRITEQIDALTVMALNPMRYLVVPTILAGLIAFPLLTAIFDLVGIYGYFGEMQTYVDFEDITQGILKSLSFGLLMTWVCCYKGFHAEYGAEGVSRATTEAVVMSSVLILIWDYFLGSVLL